MIGVKIYGGLGNQMFQYAIGRALSLKHNTKLLLDITNIDKHGRRKFELCSFNIKANIFKDKLKFRYLSEIDEKISDYKRLDDIPNNTYLTGYWQSEKWFKHIREQLIKDFTIIDNESIEFSRLSRQINESNSVSIHVRRGDYAKNIKTRLLHGLCQTEYYISAMELISEKMNNFSLFIFSDDIEWVKKNLPFDNCNKTFITPSRTKRPYEDLILMSLCKHNIIANSTFSWWAGWLNMNKNKIVIAPKRWYRLSKSSPVPSRWETI
jgi:hypothetical protein